RCFPSTFHLSGARNSQLILLAAISRRMAVCCCCERRSASSGCAGGLRKRCRIAAIRAPSGPRWSRWWVGRRRAERRPDRRDPDRVRHAMFEMVMARASAIACGYEDAIDLDRLRHDPLMKVAVGRCPDSGAALASQSTISRLENAPSKTEAARLSAALLDQLGTTVKPGKLEVLDIDDTFCAAHGGQQLAFWNAHYDERGFASMHIYHVASGTPVAAILRPARTPKGSEVCTVIKHVTKRLRRHWR